ncbi:hypothetical protein ACFPRA_09600 [Sporosarcina soli]|uniref:GSKIP domain-containing protein n=1 Tax=Sporosarcina soli TaxID=334736 RepID=A0ABW0TI77_9BACL
MEEYVVKIPNLESLFFETKDLYENVTQLVDQTSNPSSNLIYLKEERKLYLRSVSFGTLAFQFVSLDFENNQIHFKCSDESIGDANRQIYEFLTTLRWNFQPKKMSYVMERRAKFN